MKNLHEIREMLMNELRNTTEGNALTFDKLKVIDLLTHSIKSIDTINAMQESGYSNTYRNTGNRYYEYRDNRTDRDNRYSRDDARSNMIMRMEDMLDEAANDREREAIRKAMEQLKHM